ncbi:MAG: hypothetical protein ACYC28_10840 [Longimicrobiales bacterium]
MAIRDLLWACPSCRTQESLVRGGKGEVCRACGAQVRRGARATIVLEVPGQQPRAGEAWEWSDLLGEPTNGDGTPAAHVVLRDAETARPLREDGELLGFVEGFGPKIPGMLTLDEDALTFTPHDAGASRVWPILDVTAVQPASSKLQLKVKGEPVVTLRFQDGSVRLWEARIQRALRRAWRAAGRGEIVEFQPRVSIR